MCRLLGRSDGGGGGGGGGGVFDDVDFFARENN